MATQAVQPTVSDVLPEEHPHRAWKIVVPLLIVAVLATGLTIYLKGRQKPAAPVFKYETAQVTRGPLQARVTASGTVSPIITVQVGSQVSGTIKELFADYNSVVHKGQVIAKIDARLFDAAVQQARANYFAARGNMVKAEAQLADAERQAKRNRELLAQRLIAQADADTTDTALTVAKGQIEAARGALAQADAALHQTEINLAYTTITSPIDGVVISRNVDVGQTVAASLASPTLFLIAQDLKRMQVDTSIAEADVGRLAAGMVATFTVDAYPNEVFEGKIREVRNAPQTVQNVVTYDAVVDVDNSSLKLKPGMTANATVVFADRKDAVRVPNAALRFHAPQPLLTEAGPEPATTGSERVVWIRQGTEARPVVIKTGVTDGTNTELLGGPVNIGDVLVTEVVVTTRKGGPGSYGRVF